MSSISDGITWRAHAPANALVQARISHLTWSAGSSDETVLLSETHWQHNTRLAVQYNATIIFVCLASYPVIWFRNDINQKVENQNITTNEAIDIWKQKSNSSAGSSPIYEIPAIHRYKATFAIYNAASNSSAAYSCRASFIEDHQLTTRVPLTVGSPGTGILDSPKIIQTGFAEIYAHRNSSVTISIIFFSPPENDFVVYFQKRQFKIQELDTNKDISMKTIKLKKFGYFNATLTIRRLTEFHRGDYTFFIKSENETKEHDKHNFLVEILKEHTQSEIKKFRDHYHGYFVINQIYEIDFFVNKPLYSTLQDASLNVWIQLSQEENCGYKSLKSNEIYSKCGIFGVTKYDNKDVSGIKIILKVTTSCQIRAQIKRPDFDDGPKMSYLNYTSIIFPDFVHGKPIVDPINIDRQSKTAYINESFTLRCKVPICDWTSIQWCKYGTSQKCVSVDGTQTERKPDELKAKYVPLSDHTAAADLIFDRITPADNGEYVCVWHIPPERKLEDGQIGDPRTIYSLNGKNPEPPRNEDGTKFSKYERNFTNPDYISCNPYGDPPPTITWYLLKPNGQRIEISKERKILVNQSGDYECVASNWHGSSRQNIEVQVVNQTVYINQTIKEIQIEYINQTIIEAQAIVEGPIFQTSMAILVLLVIVLIAISLICCRWRRSRAALFKEFAQALKSQTNTAFYADPGIPLNEQTDLIPLNEDYEIEWDLVTIRKFLAGGNFGQVFEGELSLTGGNVRTVAVKTPRDPTKIEQHRNLVAEAKIMMVIPPHVNVVALIGACTSKIEQMKSFVVIEFCGFGSLQNYLIDNWHLFETPADDEAATANVFPLIGYAYQAANGIEHLAMQNIIHRDLALRNLLLTSDYVVKVSDFGLSRPHQKETKRVSENACLPIKWSAPEVLVERRYTPKSDIWSFGILLWELFSAGKLPYPGRNNFSLVQRLRDGYRMEKPRIATDAMYAMMLCCWEYEPDLRPTISECKRRIGEHLEEISPDTYQLTHRLLSAEMGRNFYSQQRPEPQQEPIVEESIQPLQDSTDQDVIYENDQQESQALNGTASADEPEEDHAEETEKERYMVPDSGCAEPLLLPNQDRRRSEVPYMNPAHPAAVLRGRMRYDRVKQPRHLSNAL